VAERIPLHEPVFEGNEWQYVKECLDSGWVSSAGPFVEQFEDSIRAYTGAKYAVACVNGSSALQVALRVAGVGSGHEVIVPTLTFIAPINAVYHNGAIPIFMDADEFFNIDVSKVAEFLDLHAELRDDGCWNKSTGRKITAVMPVHVFGNAVDLESLEDLGKQYQLTLIEDSAEGLGTRYNGGRLAGKHVGTVGTMGCLSFNGNKIITTGGGGMILTNDHALAEKSRYLTTQAKDDPVRSVHNEVGYNARLTNIQAALGAAQMERLPEILIQKKEIHRQYTDAVSKIEGLTIAKSPSYASNNHWLNLLQIDSNLHNTNREELMRGLEHAGIQVRPVWALNHKQRPFEAYQSYNIVNANELVQWSLCLPSSSQLSEHQMAKVISVLHG
jgi:perosamine synthetase